MPEQFLSPTETARRLGVTVKALRVYEQRGLVAPLRGENGWRAYGPGQLSALHQVLALKRLGLPLARIADLVSRRETSLDAVLKLQERALSMESTRVNQALALVRTAKARLDAGEALSIDDLAQLTKETTMSIKPTDAEMKQIFDPLAEKHFTPEQLAELSNKPFDHAAAAREWDALITEAKMLMAKGDTSSPEAMDMARRWQAQVGKFTGGAPELFSRLGNVWKDAMADPKAAPKLPMNPEIFAFVGQALAAAKKSGK